MLCVVRWLNWYKYIYITHVFYYIIIVRQRDHRNSYTTTTRHVVIVVVVHFLGTRETLIMNEFHCIWYSIQHYLSLSLCVSSPLYGNHSERGEFATLVVLLSPEKRSPLRCGHLRTATVLIPSEWTWNVTPHDAQSNGFCGFCIMFLASQSNPQEICILIMLSGR